MNRKLVNLSCLALRIRRDKEKEGKGVDLAKEKWDNVEDLEAKCTTERTFKRESMRLVFKCYLR